MKHRILVIMILLAAVYGVERLTATQGAASTTLAQDKYLEELAQPKKRHFWQKASKADISDSLVEEDDDLGDLSPDEEDALDTMARSAAAEYMRRGLNLSDSAFGSAETEIEKAGREIGARASKAKSSELSQVIMEGSKAAQIAIKQTRQAGGTLKGTSKKSSEIYTHVREKTGKAFDKAEKVNMAQTWWLVRALQESLKGFKTSTVYKTTRASTLFLSKFISHSVELAMRALGSIVSSGESSLKWILNRIAT
jgi:hypothetical protein